MQHQIGTTAKSSQLYAAVQDAGTGDMLQLRATDADVVKCRHRYDIFKVGPDVQIACKILNAEHSLHLVHVCSVSCPEAICLLTASHEVHFVVTETMHPRRADPGLSAATLWHAAAPEAPFSFLPH